MSDRLTGPEADLAAAALDVEFKRLLLAIYRVQETVRRLPGHAADDAAMFLASAKSQVKRAHSVLEDHMREAEVRVRKSQQMAALMAALPATEG